MSALVSGYLLLMILYPAPLRMGAGGNDFALLLFRELVTCVMALKAVTEPSLCSIAQFVNFNCCVCIWIRYGQFGSSSSDISSFLACWGSGYER